jgi:hypothetical protein
MSTHNNDGAIIHCYVLVGCHRNNSNTEVYTESIHIEEAKKGKECNYMSSPVPELPCWTESISTATATRWEAVCTRLIAFEARL